MMTMPDPSAAEFVCGPATPEELLETILQLRRRLLHHANLTGASASVLNAIHRAGGYVVFDPHHQDRVSRAMRALENAVTETLNHETAKWTS
jgi:hypothetical protein